MVNSEPCKEEEKKNCWDAKGLRKELSMWGELTGIRMAKPEDKRMELAEDISRRKENVEEEECSEKF